MSTSTKAKARTRKRTTQKRSIQKTKAHQAPDGSIGRPFPAIAPQFQATTFKDMLKDLAGVLKLTYVPTKDGLEVFEWTHSLPPWLADGNETNNIYMLKLKVCIWLRDEALGEELIRAWNGYRFNAAGSFIIQSGTFLEHLKVNFPSLLLETEEARNRIGPKNPKADHTAGCVASKCKVLSTFKMMEESAGVNAPSSEKAQYRWIKEDLEAGNQIPFWSNVLSGGREVLRCAYLVWLAKHG